LSDTLAEKFVYDRGENNPTPPEVEEPSIMNRLLEPPEQKEATKRFTIDLPESMHRKLSILSARTGRKKAEIIKTLLNELLKDINE
jgi:plasmid maintenance system killer protein